MSGRRSGGGDLLAFLRLDLCFVVEIADEGSLLTFKDDRILF